jgi:predicted tellurium resistance membrane protein TerC
MEGYVKMKYNIFDVMILVAFVLFCFDHILFWIAGAILMSIGGIYIIRHEDEYLEEIDEPHDLENRSRKTIKQNRKDTYAA